MIIEYVAGNYSVKNNDAVESKTSFDSQSKPQSSLIIEQAGNNTALNNTAFAPDTSKAFVLKDTIAEILPKNTNRRLLNGEISTALKRQSMPQIKRLRN